MSASALRDAYPGAAAAVVFHEDARLRDVWDALRGLDPSPPDAVTLLSQIANETLEIMPGEAMALVRAEMDHPDFLRYVAAKLGAV